MTSEDAQNKLREQCWNEALKTFGTGYLMERRAKRFRRALRILTFLGIGVPVLIGGVVLSFGFDFPYRDFVVGTAAVVLIAQLVVSVWALVAGWEDAHAYATSSASDNYSLSSRFRDLGNNPPPSYPNFRQQFDWLQVENRHRAELDYQQGISDKEKRSGLRAGLREFRKPCVECEKIPTSMRPSACDVCGNF